MSQGHRINLRGPWRVTAEPGESNKPEPANEELQFQSPDHIADWLANEMANSRSVPTSKLVVRRAFHWSFPDPPPRQINLVISDLPWNANVFVNQTTLALSAEDHAQQTWEISQLIRADNELSIALAISQVEMQLFGEVYLLLIDS